MRCSPLPLFVVFAVTLWGCGGSDPLGVEFRGRHIDVVDIHLHSGDWDAIPPSTQTFLASRFPFPLNLQPADAVESLLSSEGMLKEMDRASIGEALVLAVYAPDTLGVASNELVIERIDAGEDRLWGMASIRTDNWNTDGMAQLVALQQVLQHERMIGVKLAPPHQHFRMDDDRLWGLWSVAGQARAPVYIHTGSTPFPGARNEPAYTDPEYLRNAIRFHPDTRFVLGHAGYDFIEHELGFLETCLDLAEEYDNVFIEASALGSEESDPEGTNLVEVHDRIKSRELVDRLIYGSDGPQSPGFLEDYLERTSEAMLLAGYSADDAEAVLNGNFTRVYDR